MEKEYRFTKRKGRAIQVMFKGEYKWISTGCYTIAEAESWVIANKCKKQKDMTLTNYADGFFTEADPRGFRKRQKLHGHIYSERYYKVKQAFLEKWILPKHGFFKLSDITPRIIENLLFDIPLSNDTKNKILFIYDTILQTAKDDLLIPTNPASDIKGFTAIDAKKRDSFSDDDIQKLFPDNLSDVWDNDFWPVYFMAMHETGWRPGEMQALRVENIYPDKNAIYTDTTINLERVPQKRIKTSGHGFDYKIGFVSDRTMQLLLAHPSEDGYLFKRRGKFDYHQDTNDVLRKACRKAGVQERTQYSFRHTFDSELFGAVPDEFRKMLMGHSGKSNYDYLHLKPEEAIERAEKLKTK